MKNPLHALKVKVKVVPEYILPQNVLLLVNAVLTTHNDDFVEAV